MNITLKMICERKGPQPTGCGMLSISTEKVRYCIPSMGLLNLATQLVFNRGSIKSNHFYAVPYFIYMKYKLTSSKHTIHSTSTKVRYCNSGPCLEGWQSGRTQVPYNYWGLRALVGSNPTPSATYSTPQSVHVKPIIIFAKQLWG